MNTIKCNECGTEYNIADIDATDTKEVFQGTDISWGYFDVYSTFGLCKVCNRHILLLKVYKRKSDYTKRILKQFS